MNYSFSGGKKRKRPSMKGLKDGLSRAAANGKVDSRVVRGFARIRPDEIPRSLLKSLVDTLSFKKIFLAWIAVILVFGAVYFSIGQVSPENGLRDTESGSAVGSLFDSVYFSFITATATGFGDISPLGLSRLISVFEVIAGLTMFGILISKMVSFKQEVIISEIYDISFGEKVNRMRSSLYLFRSDAEGLMEKAPRGKLTKGMEDGISTVINNLHETMLDIKQLLCSGSKREFIKKVEDLQLELVLNSIRLSLNKLGDMIDTLSRRQIDWKTPRNIQRIKDVLLTAGDIAEYHNSSRVSSQTLKRISQIEKLKDHIWRRL